MKNGSLALCLQHAVVLASGGNGGSLDGGEQKAEPEPGWGCGHSLGRGISEAPFVTSQRDDYPRCAVNILIFLGVKSSGM